jgi:hypothetical protein
MRRARCLDRCLKVGRRCLRLHSCLRIRVRFRRIPELWIQRGELRRFRLRSWTQERLRRRHPLQALRRSTDRVRQRDQLGRYWLRSRWSS